VIFSLSRPLRRSYEVVPATPVAGDGHPDPEAVAVGSPVVDGWAPIPPRYGVEVLLVLGVSLGISAISSLIDFADIQTRPGGFAHATAQLNGAQSSRAWVDLGFQLLDVLNGVMPALLALYLLARTVAAPGFGIGFDLRRPRIECAQGLGFAALIGIPGLGLVILARHLGVNADISTSGLADIWYRYPVLVLDGIQNGVLEEVVMIGFLLTRFRQLNWPPIRAVLVSAAIRGCYHTYQGVGGFVGNFVMGAIFGYWFTRSRRVLPLVIAHSVIDIVSFVGYAALHGRISWI
jgi:membrane protease YdiL (CAAX protease family)